MLGARFGADRALMIELTQYTTREPESPHLYRGRIAANNGETLFILGPDDRWRIHGHEARLAVGAGDDRREQQQDDNAGQPRAGAHGLHGMVCR